MQRWVYSPTGIVTVAAKAEAPTTVAAYTEAPATNTSAGAGKPKLVMQVAHFGVMIYDGGAMAPYVAPEKVERGAE